MGLETWLGEESHGTFNDTSNNTAATRITITAGRFCYRFCLSIFHFAILFALSTEIVSSNTLGGLAMNVLIY